MVLVVDIGNTDTKFGIFVGLDEGIDGLVHVSDISWTEQMKHPSEQFKKGDEIVLVTTEGGQSTRVKGLFSPRGMSEMRDAGDRWDDTEVAHAASGLKISAPDLDNVLAGTTLRVVHTDSERAEAKDAAKAEAELSIELEEEGVAIKADTGGGREALAKELATGAAGERSAPAEPASPKGADA